MATSTSLAKKICAHPAWALIAAFGAYFCMYGFRKPYTAATYSNVFFFGIDYKFLLIIAQTIGYVLAKWIGIKMISEIKAGQRVKMLLVLIFVAECMLLFFGLVPRPWNIICLWLNGLSLGMVFGLILGFLEGRKNTEALIAGLCASFIVSDGVSKSVGKMLLDNGITENWMPFLAGLLFLIPTLIFIAMLNKVPPPSEADIATRSIRTPMKAQARWDFFMKYAPGLAGITIAYLFVTLLRSIRADFAPELWRDLGYRQTPAVFTQSELWVSFGVVVINGLAIYIRNHYKAFQGSLLTSLGGFIILLFALWGLKAGMGKFTFMVLIGFGVYIPYVSIHTTIFERLIAITKERANIGFLMYLVDSVGYTGYILLMLFRYTMPPGDSILFLFLRICLYLGITGALIILYCKIYFTSKLKNNARSIIRLSPGQSGHF
ncbi:MAG: DUF5690 family protein [Puia sp.]|nr:DUF5690 family protein [Puia sp.]